MYLRHFDPGDVAPELLVNRANLFDWLVEAFQSYFEDARQPGSKPLSSLALGLHGEKGIGKSIIIQAALRKLRENFSSDTIFLFLDCRPLRSMREVLAEVADRILRELDEMRSAAGGARPARAIPAGLIEQAQILVELTRYDVAEQKVIHEQMRKFRSVLAAETGASGSRRGTTSEMLAYLKLHFHISLELETKDINALSGQVVFDIPRLVQLFEHFFRDLRAAGVRVCLFLDNVDELHHDYRDARIRQVGRDEAEWVLRFREAPIGLLVCLRTYFAGVLPRGMTVRVVDPLPVDEMRKILRERVERESEKNQKTLNSVDVQMLADELIQRAKTPLALLSWFRYAAYTDRLRSGVRDIANSWCEQERFPMLGRGVLAPILDLFREKKTRGHLTISRDEMLAALGGNELHFLQLQHAQAILPRDFWNPVEFTIDPELDWLLA